MKFFKLYRRRGFAETMEVLEQFPKKEAPQGVFFAELKNRNSYPNTFFRVKQDLLSEKLIAYKLNKENDKVIYLTIKGLKVMAKIREIEELL